MSKVIFVLVETATTEINEAIKVYSALQKSGKACIWLRYRLHAMHMPRLVKRGKINFGIFFGKYSSSNEFQQNRKSQKQTKIVDTSAVCRFIGRRSASWIGLGWIASFDIWAVGFCGYHQNLTHSIFFVSSFVFVSVALVASTDCSLLRQIIFMGLILWCHLWCFTNIWIGSVIVAHEIEHGKFYRNLFISIWQNCYYFRTTLRLPMIFGRNQFGMLRNIIVEKIGLQIAAGKCAS